MSKSSSLEVLLENLFKTYGKAEGYIVIKQWDLHEDPDHREKLDRFQQKIVEAYGETRFEECYDIDLNVTYLDWQPVKGSVNV